MRANKRQGEGERGSVLIEFAIVIPLLVLLALGGSELVLYLFLNQKLSYLANRVADLTARETLIDNSQLQTIYAIAPSLMQPFRFRDNEPDGRIIISIIQRRNPSDPQPTIIKQNAGGGTLNVQSELGREKQHPNFPANFVPETWETVIAGEVFYEYQPWFLTDIFASPQRIYHRAFYRPRVPATFNVVDHHSPQRIAHMAGQETPRDSIQNPPDSLKPKG